VYAEGVGNRSWLTYFLDRDPSIIFELLGLSERTGIAIDEHHEPLRVLRLIVLLHYPFLYVGIVLEAGVLQADLISDDKGFRYWIADITWVFEGLL